MAEKSKKYPHAFFERNSWYHRTKVLQEDSVLNMGRLEVLKQIKKQKRLIKSIWKSSRGR